MDDSRDPGISLNSRIFQPFDRHNVAVQDFTVYWPATGGKPRQPCGAQAIAPSGRCPMAFKLNASLRLVPALLAGFFILSSVGLRDVTAQVFSVDPASPLKRPADLFTPGPTLYAPAESIGLLAADDIDALSFGFDDVTSPEIRFSVGYFATGAILGGNAVCSEAGTCAPGVPCPPEASADIFRTNGLGSASLLFDGDGLPGSAPPLGLSECPAGGPR